MPDSRPQTSPPTWLSGEIESSLPYQILTQSHDAVWLRGLPDGGVTFLGNGFESLWGISLAAATENPEQLHDRLHPLDRAIRVARWQSPVESYDWEIEYRIIRPNEELRWVRETAFVLRDATGRITHGVGFMRDVTYYKLFGLTRRENEERFQKFFDQNPIGCCMVSARSLRFTAVNAAFAQMTGYSADELIGQRPDDLGLWLDETLPNLMVQSLRQCPHSEQLETTLRVRHGHLCQIALTAMAVDVGEQRYIALLCQDVTSAKHLQSQLMDSEARFRALFMGLPDMVAHISQDGRVYDLNRVDFGYEKGQLMARNFFDWFVPEDQPKLRAALADSLTKASQRPSFEARIQLSTEQPQWCAGRIAGVHFNQSAAEFLITLRDIADQKRAADELRRLNEEISEANIKLRELDKLKARFAATLIHDLRSPLTCIHSVLEILDDASIEDSSRQLIAVSQSSLQRALDMISNIQHVYQSEEGLLKLNCAPVTPQTFIRPCWEASCIEAQRKRLNLTLDYAFDTASPELPLVYGDASKLERAMSNLLSNAIKFTPPGGSIRVSVAVVNGEGVNIGRDFVEVSILDTGTGIPPEDLPYVFDVYRQSRNNRTGVGFGLGLSIVKSIIAAHGGDVRVESQIGVGTRFFFHLPVYLGEAGESGNVAQKSPETIF
ncbi:MAG: ATP-binding protein [Chloracidobacterium sp.]